AAAEIAHVLERAQVAYVLWGWMALGLVGAYQRSGAIEIIVSDSQMQLACNSLAKIGLKPCRDDECETVVLGRLRPVPAAHFHIGFKYRGCTALSFLAKSELLWWWKDFPLLAPGKDHPDILLTTDPRLPPCVEYGCTGPWTDLHPIRILNPSSFTEAIILLACRDYNQPNHLFPTWGGMLDALRGYKEYPATLVKKSLRPEFQAFWKDYCSDRSVDQIYAGFGRKLRYELIKADRLPAPPAYSALKTGFNLDF
ncbi:hypothetical protein N7512_005407, partial [Penicillium capsulatum]